MTISTSTWVRTLGIVAPLARRRPNSRIRCVTLCHTTPVRPSATISSRNTAMVPTTISGLAYWRSLSSRIVSSVCTSNDQSCATAWARFTSASSNAAVVPGLTRIVSSCGTVSFGFDGARLIR